MCVYGKDNALFFQDALTSVYKQTWQPTEVVLVVDGPVPSDIDSVIDRFQKDHGLRVHRLEQNMGHGEARRCGFSLCQYDYVAIADADDINDPTRFEKELTCLAGQPELCAVSSACTHFCDSLDNVLNVETFPTDDASIKKAMRTGCPICQPSVMLKKTAVEQAGGYLDWYYCEDYYLWIRMLLNGASFANLPESLLYLRTTQEQILRRGGWKYYRSLRRLYQFMRKNKVITFGEYLFNSSSRFVVQVLLPPRARAWLRRKLQ